MRTELKVARVSRLFRHLGSSPEHLSYRHEDRDPGLEGPGKVMSSLRCPGMSLYLWFQVSDGYTWFPDQFHGRECENHTVLTSPATCLWTEGHLLEQLACV